MVQRTFTRKHLLLVPAILVLVATAIGISVAGVTATKEDDVVATINGTPITRDMFYQRLEQTSGEKVLENLISETLLVQAQKTEGITVADNAIQQEMEKIKSQFPDDKTFTAQLNTAGLSLDDLKQRIRLSLVFRELSTRDITITKNDIKQYFDQNKDRLGTPEKRKVRHILVDTEKEANAVRSKLEDGADFAELARKYSKDPATKDKGGELGFIRADGPLDPAFTKAAFNLKVGQLSQPVKSQFGYHLIEVLDKVPAKPAVYEENVERIRSVLTNQRAKPASEVIADLKKKATITINWSRYADLEAKRTP